MTPAPHRLPFGRYAGIDLDEVPTSYLGWLVREAKLSTGLRSAVVAELAKRGVSVPPPPQPAPRTCRECGVSDVTAHWFTMSNGQKAIRGECRRCGHWLGTLPQVEPYLGLADAGTDRAALLTFLLALGEAGIDVRLEGGRLVYDPPGRMTRDLWALEHQCKNQLVARLAPEPSAPAAPTPGPEYRR